MNINTLSTKLHFITFLAFLITNYKSVLNLEISKHAENQVVTKGKICGTVFVVSV